MRAAPIIESPSLSPSAGEHDASADDQSLAGHLFSPSTLAVLCSGTINRFGAVCLVLVHFDASLRRKVEFLISICQANSAHRTARTLHACSDRLVDLQFVMSSSINKVIFFGL